VLLRAFFQSLLGLRSLCREGSVHEFKEARHDALPGQFKPAQESCRFSEAA
jgi:hypothetical protein